MELIYNRITNKNFDKSNIGKGINWIAALDELRSAPIFRIDNIAEYFWASEQDYWEYEKDFPNLAPPFNAFWMEYVTPLRVHVGGRYVENDKYKQFGFLFVSKKKESELGNWEWALNAIFFSSQSGVTGGGHFNHFFGIDQTGKIIHDSTGKSQIGFAVDPEIQKQYSPLEIQEMAMIIHPALLAISFMHCKNVELIEHGVSRHGHRSRHTHGIKYHTLEIEPMKRILRTEGQSESTGLKQALHICRGHFKDFSKGAGLFGKYKGLYWWDSQVRGSAEHGEVRKDYDVKPPKPDDQD